MEQPVAGVPLRRSKHRLTVVVEERAGLILFTALSFDDVKVDEE